MAPGIGIARLGIWPSTGVHQHGAFGCEHSRKSAAIRRKLYPFSSDCCIPQARATHRSGEPHRTFGARQPPSTRTADRTFRASVSDFPLPDERRWPPNVGAASFRRPARRTCRAAPSSTSSYVVNCRTRCGWLSEAAWLPPRASSPHR
jgi:hypothetical protein